MSPPRREAGTRELRKSAPIFAALGDETRLALLARLGGGARSSITTLSAGSPLSRQAITKHLRSARRGRPGPRRAAGRENLFELKPDSLDEAIRSLARISKQWDHALARLKSFVED